MQAFQTNFYSLDSGYIQIGTDLSAIYNDYPEAIILWIGPTPDADTTFLFFQGRITSDNPDVRGNVIFPISGVPYPASN
jgi:hypothetical protein